MKAIVKKILMTTLICGAASAVFAGGQQDAAETDSGVNTVKIVTSATYEPYCYVDEDGNISGFDVEILRAIDKVADEIECSFEYAGWDAMFPGLDSDRYDLVVYQLSRKPSREEMYHFGDYPYSCTDGDMIITRPENASWTSLDDAAASGDVTFGAIVGSSFTSHLEDYLEEHPGAYGMKYYETEIDTLIEDLSNGRIDGLINDPNVAMQKAIKAGMEDNIAIAGCVAEGTPAWYIFADDERGHELSAIFDKYLVQLYEEGVLQQIAKDMFGSDNSVTNLAKLGYYK